MVMAGRRPAMTTGDLDNDSHKMTSLASVSRWGHDFALVLLILNTKYGAFQYTSTLLYNSKITHNIHPTVIELNIESFIGMLDAPYVLFKIMRALFQGGKLVITYIILCLV